MTPLPGPDRSAVPVSLEALAGASDRIRDLLDEIREVSAVISSKNWSEANAGNLSVNVTAFLDRSLPAGRQWYLVSRGGSRYRQLARDPLPHLVLVETGEDADLYHPSAALPTSEWATHKLLQRHFEASDREQTVILHSHPAEIIILSQLPIYNDDAAFNRELQQVLPETALYLEQGVALAGFAPPGSDELAAGSLAALKGRKALIWQKHGLLCFGRTLSEALDYMEIVAKAAGIWLQLRNLGL
jgi:rhamnulose-1-phosphate aldolase